MQAKSQSAAVASLAHQPEIIRECVATISAGQPGAFPRLQALVCAAIPIYNTFAVIEGWPPIPIPAFCSAPLPVPTP